MSLDTPVTIPLLWKFVGACALTATVTLFIVNGDDTSAIESKLDAILTKIQQIEDDQDQYALVSKIELWVERARQAPDLRSLPDLPR